MTLLGPDTIAAIRAHRKAEEAHEKAQRLAEIGRKQRAYQIRLLVRLGYGWEDLLDPKHNLGISREDARAAVLWGPK